MNDNWRETMLEHLNDEEKASDKMRLTILDIVNAAQSAAYWKAIAFCRSCEPLDGYYCTKHREETDE